METADKAGVLQRAKDAEINLRTDIVGAVGVTLKNEVTTREDVVRLIEIISGKAFSDDIDTLRCTGSLLHRPQFQRQCCVKMRC